MAIWYDSLDTTKLIKKPTVDGVKSDIQSFHPDPNYASILKTTEQNEPIKHITNIPVTVESGNDAFSSFSKAFWWSQNISKIPWLDKSTLPTNTGMKDTSIKANMEQWDTINKSYNDNVNQALADLIVTYQTNWDISPDELKVKFPEFSWKEQSVADFLATLEANWGDMLPEDVQVKFPEFFDSTKTKNSIKTTVENNSPDYNPFFNFIGKSLDDTMTRFSNIWSELKDAAKDILGNPLELVKNPFMRTQRIQQAIARVIGEWAWFVGWDLPINAIQSLATPKGVELFNQGIESLINRIGQDNIWRQWLEFLWKGMDAYNQWAESHPEVAKDINAAVNIASLIPAEKIATVTAKAAKSGVVWDTLKWLSNEFDNAIINPIDDTIAKWKSVIDDLWFPSSQDWQSELLKAKAPSLNKLGKKEKSLANIKGNEQRANAIIAENQIQKWLPVPDSVESYFEAHKTALTDKWAEVKAKVGSAVGDVKLQSVADDIDNYISENRFLADTAPEIKKDITLLMKQRDALLKRGTVTPVEWELLKETFNSLIKWGDTWKSDVYNKGMKILAESLNKSLDNVVSEIPWEFLALKQDWWVLKNTFEDTLKMYLRDQKKKGLWLVESYSRIEWVSDIISGIIGLSPSQVGRWVTKIWIGKALQKFKDPDILIKRWFSKLEKQVKSWIKPKTEVINSKSVKDLVEETKFNASWLKTKKELLEQKSLFK